MTLARARGRRPSIRQPELIESAAHIPASGRGALWQEQHSSWQGQEFHSCLEGAALNAGRIESVRCYHSRIADSERGCGLLRPRAQPTYAVPMRRIHSVEPRRASAARPERATAECRLRRPLVAHCDSALRFQQDERAYGRPVVVRKRDGCRGSSRADSRGGGRQRVLGRGGGLSRRGGSRGWAETRATRRA
jgi:hypothetical protein